MKNVYAVILAGGKGERFWPLSTQARPKQLLTLFGGKSFLAQAFERLRGLIPADHVFVITGEDLLAAVRADVPEIPADQIIGEPMGRDTAAACAVGLAVVKRKDPSASFCILTADQLIESTVQFQTVLREAFTVAAEQDSLITIGIKPEYPSTGFGYIEAGVSWQVRDGVEFRHVRRFVEKPDAATARQYVDSGSFYWNSGMFVWSVAAFSKALKRHCPNLSNMADELCSIIDSDQFNAHLRQRYAGLERISIDYAVMEKSDNILVARATFDWDDAGSWRALERHFPGDDKGNVAIGECETLNSHQNVVFSQERVTVLLGVKDLVVVQANGVTLVCGKDHAEKIKDVVRHMHAKGGYEHLL